MKKLSAVLFALALSACGGDQPMHPAPDPMSFLPPSPQPVAVTKVDAGVEIHIDTPKALPTKYDEALALGRELVGKGDKEGAKEMFEAAIKLDKKKAEPHIELARLFIATGERGPAVIAANKAVKLAPDSSQAWNTLGRAELARFNYDGAVTAFRQSTELNPENAWAWNNLGFTNLALKQYKEAVDALVMATTKKGVEGYMWNNLGTAYEQLDQLDNARAAFDKGGTLGSKEALASRKRLEGVKSILVVKAEPKATKDAPKTYEAREPMPEIKPEESKPDEPKDEAKPEIKDETKDAAKPETKVEQVKDDEKPVPPASL
jgi:tetratricopeptide (TPR) repeat protein